MFTVDVKQQCNNNNNIQCGANVYDVDMMYIQCGANVYDVDLMCNQCGANVDDVDLMYIPRTVWG